MFGSVAVIGLGAMGLPMASRLLQAGFDVRGYDRNSEACAQFTRVGGHAAASAAEAARDAAALLLLVVNADQAEAVLFGDQGAALAMARGSVVMLSLTTAPGRAADIGRRLEQHGILMLDCPVSGGVTRAANGTLSILASGPAQALDAVRPCLSALGGRIFEIGSEHGQASTVKLLNQALCGVHLAVAAEVVALAERAGVDRQMVYDVIVASSGTSWMFVDRVSRMLREDATATAAIDILLKDLRLVGDLGRSVGASLALSHAAEELFSAASAAGMGQRNDSEILQFLREAGALS